MQFLKQPEINAVLSSQVEAERQEEKYARDMARESENAQKAAGENKISFNVGADEWNSGHESSGNDQKKEKKQVFQIAAQEEDKE